MERRWRKGPRAGVAASPTACPKAPWGAAGAMQAATATVNYPLQLAPALETGVEEPEAEASFGPAAVEEAGGKHCAELNALDEVALVPGETMCVEKPPVSPIGGAPAQGATVVISSERSSRPSMELWGVKEEGGETPPLPTDEDNVALAVFPPSMLDSDEEAAWWSDSSGYEWDGLKILKSPLYGLYIVHIVGH